MKSPALAALSSVGLAALLAGCLQPSGPPDASCPPAEPAPYRALPVDRLGRVLDLDRPWEGLAVRFAPATPYMVRDRPHFWNAKVEELSPEPANVSLLRPVLQATVNSDPGGRLEIGYWEPPLKESCGARQAAVAWDLLKDPDPTEVAAVGKGVHVYTAGFWLNGTLFYTNVDTVDQSDWPRAGWYAWESGETLPVYVYNQTREEEPAHWKPQANPVTGESVVEGYFTTIAGFNEALKNISTSTSRVVLIPPEKAYTLPGREDHPLYGDALVFWIRAVDVVDLPCPRSPPLPCDVAVPEPVI